MTRSPKDLLQTICCFGGGGGFKRNTAFSFEFPDSSLQHNVEMSVAGDGKPAGQRSVNKGAVERVGSEAGETKSNMAYILKYMCLYAVLFKIFSILQGEFYLVLPGCCFAR